MYDKQFPGSTPINEAKLHIKQKKKSITYAVLDND